jgi:hypothetical protein
MLPIFNGFLLVACISGAVTAILGVRQVDFYVEYVIGAIKTL